MAGKPYRTCNSSEDDFESVYSKSACTNSLAHELNRAGTRSTNRYLKSIYYGNRISRLVDGFETGVGRDAPMADSTKWMFEVVFDYGEHDRDVPQPSGSETWLVRNDPFSSYRAGFEVRTYRLCQRILMFHHFPGESGGINACLARLGRSHPQAIFETLGEGSDTWRHQVRTALFTESVPVPELSPKKSPS